VGAARDGAFVVVVAGVAGHPVVGAGDRGAGAVGGFVVAVCAHVDGAVGGAQGAIALTGVKRLEGAAGDGVGAEQARQGGLVLERVPDGAGGGPLPGRDPLPLHDALPIFVGAARDGAFVVVVAGVAGHPVVGASDRGAGAVGGFVVAVCAHVDG